MVFSSVVFLCVFLPVFLVTYYAVPIKFKNYILLLFSIIFYAWGAPNFVFILLVSLFFNFHVTSWMNKSNSYKTRKAWLVVSLCINLGLLVYFKYFNFFIDNINHLFSILNLNFVSWEKILLPIGISFFTFQSITYTVDVYKKVSPPLQKFSDYILYILMFPQLIAGPIVRFNTIAAQITSRKMLSSNVIHGFYRFIIGLSKKVLIANIIGEQVDLIYATDPDQISSLLAWLAAFGYSFQIYFDFSGYSDMAIGIGKMLGFKFPENFDNPYISKNFTEFWRRWHMSLGAFMRDYMYIPIGGNRVNKRYKLYFNLWIVFLASGIWHGASWNFLLWGAYHGIFLIIDRIFLKEVTIKIHPVFSMVFTYFLVVIGWVIFRIEDIESAFQYLKKMFQFTTTYSEQFNIPNRWIIIFIVAFVFSFIRVIPGAEKLENFAFFKKLQPAQHLLVFPVSIILLIVCLSYISASGFNPFIYFRF